MAGSMDPAAVFVPARPAQLVIGDRSIPVDDWPLSGRVEESRSLDLTRPDEDTLLLGPGRRSWAWWVAHTALVVLIGTLPGVAVLAVQAPGWMVGLTVAVLAGFLLILARDRLSALRWTRFDRRANTFAIERRAGFRPDRRVERAEPLARVRAVQLLYSGRHSVTESQGDAERPMTTHREFHGYELNLILDDPETPRLNLASVADWAWVRSTGGAIGTFLDVPVLDRLYHGA